MFDFTSNLPTTLWIGGGVLLILTEFFIPGTFVAFLGTSGIITGIVVYFFDISIGWQFGLWIFLSALLIYVGSTAIRKIFPAQIEHSIPKNDEVGKLVPVVKDVLVERKGGRVLFQGVEWDAISKKSRIPKGNKARILSRDNLTFLVEPLELPEE
ncbi:MULTISPECIES: NfeD family protein [Leptospira]|uniref:Peptidase n=2 Tax=Leptospira kirschneri TaxID=29507 RepID=A0A1T1DJX3_9LEPT|nr:MULTISPECIES: NfeD family protein [Leptospira]EJO70773.1 nodulation efficiency protein NfeD [Leptospira kirschneri serovar Grippotyphosa str. RM52]EKO51148.1 nodulation efficiency protein NfeD [Leptospira kirschneri str. 200802841]EKQ84217.1 nodulation efficiency protein NfeD [Leptospira kirschneri serovar Grippotyphosa str. Moskva]EKR10016.1 nodulation efficiency protein NfeD [Leptospira kirschneri serovar Valbuzzi str. 200702274]EMJ91556.1 nodulation efficiency protein NfeD [Leptospira ki